MSTAPAASEAASGPRPSTTPRRREHSRFSVDLDVTVTSEQNVVQDSPTSQTLISGTQVLEIPLQNRDFTKLLELTPGVSSSLDDETGLGLTSRFDVSINGMRRNSVNCLTTSSRHDSAAPKAAALRNVLPTLSAKARHLVTTFARLGPVRRALCVEGQLNLQVAREYARANGAPGVEVYPVDPEGRMDTTMAFVGTIAYVPLFVQGVIGTSATASGVVWSATGRSAAGCSTAVTSRWGLMRSSRIPRRSHHTWKWKMAIA